MRFWIVQLDRRDNVVAFLSVPIDDLPLFATKAGDWAEMFEGYGAARRYRRP